MSYRRFIQEIGIYGVAQLVVALGGFITLPIITKLLGAESYGIWSQLSVTMVLISTVTLLGLPYTLVRFLAGEKDQTHIQDGIWSVMAIIFSISVIIAILFNWFAAPIAGFFHCAKIFVQILGFIILFDQVNQVLYSVFRTFRNIKAFSFFLIFQELADAGFIIIAIYLGYGLLGALLAFLTVRALNCLIMGTYVIKTIGLKTPEFLKLREYLAFGIPTIPDNLSNWVVQSSDRYLVGFFLGTIYVGYYAPAYVMGVFVINFLIAPFSFLLPAVLSKSYDENKIDEVKIYLRYSLKYFLLLAIPSVFGLSVLSQQLLTIFTTPEIANVGHLVMPIVAISMIPMGANAIISQIIGIAKKTKAGGTITVIAALVNFGLNIIFIPRFGIIGAAITTLVAYTLISLATWIYSFKFLSFHIDWNFILKSTSASIVMTVAVLIMAPLGFYRTIIAVAAGAAIYFILIFAFHGISKQEFELLRKFIRGAA